MFQTSVAEENGTYVMVNVLFLDHITDFKVKGTSFVVSLHNFRIVGLTIIKLYIQCPCTNMLHAIFDCDSVSI
jgi:hypothetical protein